VSFITEHNQKFLEFRPTIRGRYFTEKQTYAGCVIHPGVYLGQNVLIGPGTIIYPNAVIYDGVEIGRNCVIDSGAIIGAEGFSTRMEDGKAIRLKNVAKLKLEMGLR